MILKKHPIADTKLFFLSSFTRLLHFVANILSGILSEQGKNFYFPVQFHWITPFCSKYFVQDCLSKQFLGPYSVQSLSNSNFLTFSKAFFMNFNKNIKQVSCIKILNLMALSKNCFSYFI